MSIEGAYRKYIGTPEEGKVSTPRVIHVMNREKDILPVAEETIEKMLRPLYQEGHKAGYDDGYNKGYAQGYAKAIEWALKRLTEGGK